MPDPIVTARTEVRAIKRRGGDVAFNLALHIICAQKAAVACTRNFDPTHPATPIALDFARKHLEELIRLGNEYADTK